MRIKIKTPEVIKELKFLYENDLPIFSTIMLQLFFLVLIMLAFFFIVYLLNEVNIVKGQLREVVEATQTIEYPVVTGYSETPLLRIRITINNMDTEEAERIIETYSNEIDTGNSAIDTAIVEYLDKHMDSHIRKGEDICDCGKPTFFVSKRQDSADIAVAWDGVFNFLPSVVFT